MTWSGSERLRDYVRPKRSAGKGCSRIGTSSDVQAAEL